MPRIARVVVPGLPHHVTQRGNRRAPIFLEPGDQTIYRRILADECVRRRVEVWAYCLMPNHAHLILTPSDETGLALAVGESHRRYTCFINTRQGWMGHLFQGRYASVAMDERHLLAAARYVTLNPVRARLVNRAEDWLWSSARAHLEGSDDGLVVVRPLLDRVESFAELLGQKDETAFASIRASESTGRPLGDSGFVAELEARLGRMIGRRPGGRPAAGRPGRGHETHFP
jgi:putative transposase